MKRTLRLFTLAAAFCLGLSAAHSQTAPVVVYHDGLASGWTDWSWNTERDLASTKVLHGNKEVIAASSKPFGTFALHSDGTQTNGLATLSFWINGGETGGQQLRLILNGEAGIPSAVKLDKLSKDWTHVEVPLSKLGVAAGTPLTLIWLQDFSTDPAPTYYIDSIEVK